MSANQNHRKKSLDLFKMLYKFEHYRNADNIEMEDISLILIIILVVVQMYSFMNYSSDDICF